MLYQIISLLLDVAVGLLAGACLLRLYMQQQRVSFANPLGRFVFALTNWLVLPLRRVLPAVGRWDTASLVAAYLLELAQYGLLWLLAGGGREAIWLLVLAGFGLARLVLSAIMGLVLVYAVLSWVQGGRHSPLYDVIDRLCAPLLRPWRRLIPLVGGVDLSPLALLVAVQIATIVLGSVQATVLRWG
jgi:YggT family protein